MKWIRYLDAFWGICVSNLILAHDILVRVWLVNYTLTFDAGPLILINVIFPLFCRFVIFCRNGHE